jgi:hypothetical protein
MHSNKPAAPRRETPSAATRARSYTPAAKPTVPLADAVCELFTLSEKIQAGQRCHEVTAFSLAAAARPDLYCVLTNAPADKLDVVLERLERAKERARPNAA